MTLDVKNGRARSIAGVISYNDGYLTEDGLTRVMSVLMQLDDNYNRC